MAPVSTLIALADPTRCRIIEILRDGPQPVHVLAAGFTISRPAISRHLRVLKQARLITEKKTGRENVYRLQANKLEPVQRWLTGILPSSSATTAVETSPGTGAPLMAETPSSVVSAILVAASSPVAEQHLPFADETTLVEPARKPRKREAISQMGFDF